MKSRNAMERSRILIVDDHPPLREALAARIGRQSDLQVCGEAADLAEALRLVASVRPDVVVVDITLKDGNGIELVKRLKSRDDRVRVLVWSMHAESLYAERALRAGALGYITKDQETNLIIEAIRRVRDGKTWLSETMNQRLLLRNLGQDRQGRSPVDMLADRELEVFRLIGEGMKTSEIATRLHLSVKTVETYRDRIRQKLEISDGTKLAHFATQWVMQQSN
ncbi:MAG: DNA-binding response regulator [Planctomycetia bacterium]|nr:DNA-binding response regulator [Planctomycetia bacterium]